MAATGSPILWQDDEGTVTLIDIPRSISAAQGTVEDPCYDALLSTEPLREPYSTQEPKSSKAKKNAQNNSVDEEVHTIYRDILHKSLESVRKNHDQDWALARRSSSIQDLRRNGKKRKLNVQDVPQEHEASTVKSRVTRSTSTAEPADSGTRDLWPSQDQDSKEEYVPCSTCSLDDFRFHANYSPSPLRNQRLQLCENLEAFIDAVRIPPYSSFYIGDCAKDSRAFHQAIRHQASEHETRRHFDFVLLDPPWPNRSAWRTYQTAGSGYDTADSLNDVYDLLLKMDLDMLMAEDCLVAMWITNKQSIRELVLGEDGIFDQWGVELEEEWIWLKTTLHGEPVTPIDSSWRKPYEVLLLGRKQRRGQSQPVIPVKRKAIMAVPDFHSRKPCLKELIEPLMPDAREYRALEVFARHLVAGWWSWGNECTKFNCEYWYSVKDFDGTSAKSQ